MQKIVNFKKKIHLGFPKNTNKVHIINTFSIFGYTMRIEYKNFVIFMFKIARFTKVWATFLRSIITWPKCQPNRCDIMADLYVTCVMS